MNDKTEIKNPKVGALLQVALAGISFGTIPIFAALLREQNISVALQVFFRLAVTAIILAPFMWHFTRHKLKDTNRGNWLILFANGLLIFAAFFTYIFSIALGTPVGKAVLLVYIYPVFTVLLGVIFLKESMDRTRALSIVLAMSGAAIVMEFWAIGNVAGIRAGELLAICNSFFSACIIVLGRYIGRDNKRVHPLSVTFFSFVFALIWLAAATFILRFSSLQIISLSVRLNLNTTALPYLMGIAVISTLMPYLLLYFGLTKIEATTASILLLLEPVSVFIMGKVILSEPIKLPQIIGGSCILVAVYLTSRRQLKNYKGQHRNKVPML
jgi:drug/metabolite transporter (DMT)-like permease